MLRISKQGRRAGGYSDAWGDVPDGTTRAGWWTVRQRRRAFLAVILTGAIGLAACGDDGGGAGGAGGGGGGSGGGSAITIALGSEPTSLDPHTVDDGGERAITDNVYETLLTRTPDGELAPGLATDLPTQLDETTWQFTLRA